MVRRGSPVRVRTRAWLANASGMSRVADEAPLDPLLPPLALAPDVEHNRRGRPSQLLGEGRRGDPLDPRDEVGARVEGLHPALEMTGHVVEPNATQPHHRLLLPPRLGDDHDRSLTLENRPGPGCIAPAEPGREQEAVMRLGRIGFDNVAGHLEGGMQALDPRPDLVARIERITAATLAEQLAGPAPPVVLDVRSEREWREERIQRSLNIPPVSY